RARRAGAGPRRGGAAGGEPAQPLWNEILRNEPAGRPQAGGGAKDDGGARHDDERLVPCEQRATGADGQGAVRALDRPRALQKAREPLRVDVRDAVVGTDQRQLADGAAARAELAGRGTESRASGPPGAGGPRPRPRERSSGPAGRAGSATDGAKPIRTSTRL